MDSSTLLVALVAAPLVASIAMALIPARAPRQAFEAVHGLSALAVLVGAVKVALPVFMGGEVVTAWGPWFRVDALGAIFVLLIGALGLDRKSTRLNSSHWSTSRMPSSA